MCDGYNPSLKDDHPNLEDELLCEYVDGTMDPVVREVFEEYLCANPDIKKHVECLRDTRLLLCHYGCRCHAPRDLHDRLRRQITCDLLNGKAPFHILVADRLKGATMSSAVAVLLVIGLAGGFSMIQSADLRPTVVSAAVVTSTHNGASPEHAGRLQFKMAPNPIGRMSALGPLPSSHITTSIISSEQMAPVTDTSLALLLEQSSLQP